MDKGIIIHTAITNDDGQLLIIRRQPNDHVLAGHWDIPGGRLEDGEDPAAGAIRETREETGLEIKQLQLFSYTSNVDPKKNKQFIRLIFRARFGGGTIRLNPDEHDDFQWINPANPPDLSYVDYMPEVINKLVISEKD